MRKLLQFNKSKTFFSFMRSYLYILIIPVVLGIVIYLISIGALRKEITSLHSVYLEQAKTTIDTHAQSIISISYGLNSNHRIKSLYFVPEDNLSTNNIYTLGEIKNDFNSLMISNPLIKSIDIFYINGGYMIGNVNRTESRRLHDTIKTRYNMEFDDWYSFVAEPGKYRIRVIQNPDLSSDLLLAIPLGYEIDSPATLLVVADGKIISESFSELAGIRKGQGIIMIDAGDGLFLDANLFPISEEVLDIRISHDAYSKNVYSVGKYTIVQSDSVVTGWKYLLVLPSSMFYAKAQQILNVLYAYIIISMMIGIILAVYFSRKSYAPIHRLKYLLRSVHADTNRDDYRFLEQAIRSILSHQRGLETQLRKRTETLRDDYLRKLVNGTASESSFNKTEAIYGLSFQGNRFLVLIFLITDFGVNFSSSGEQDEQSYELIKVALLNVITELISANISVFLFEMDEKLVCLVNGKAEPDLSSTMKEYAEQVTHIFSTMLGVTLIYSAGSEGTGMDSIRCSYDDAYKGISKMMQKDNGIFHYSKASIEAITQYLLGNFRNPNLSLVDLADEFSLNSSYISHIFKKRTGVGIQEFIQRLRISEGKKLLGETDLTLADIALQCGYYSVHAFSSVFKKYERVTPGHYRSLQRKMKD